MLEKYYNILGITPSATLAEIKFGYRKRAKELHPDVNKSPDAHQDFILLSEAYEYLINLKTGKVFEKNTTTTRRYKTYERWQDNEAARARHRAEYYASRKYNDFTQSEYYKKMKTVDSTARRLVFFLAMGALVILPVALTLIKVSTGFWIFLTPVYFFLAVQAIFKNPWSSFAKFVTQNIF